MVNIINGISIKIYNRKQNKLYITIILFLLCCSYSFAQNIDLSGKLTFSSYYIQDATPIFLGTVKLNMTTSSSAIKSYISATYTESTVTTEENLEKAYIKMRLPFFLDKTMRLNVGKMPISWGYGQIFNAGDLVFGALPTTLTYENIASSVDSLDDMRSDTEWMLNASIPVISNICNFEPLAVIPMQEVENTQDTDFESEDRFGGRLFFTPYHKQLETFEIGYLGNTNLSTHKIYIGLDGSLYLDYNICSSITIGEKDSWVLSNGLQKIINFTNYQTGNDHALTLKTEELWYPFEENILVFSFASYTISNSITAGVYYIYSYYTTSSKTATTNSFVTSLTISPISSLDLGLSSSLPDISKPAKNWTTAISVTYSF
jgi:hypothetical protein